MGIYQIGLVLHDRYLGRIYGTYIPFKLVNNSGGSNNGKTVLVLRDDPIDAADDKLSGQREGRTS